MKNEHDSNSKTEPKKEESFSFLKETIKPNTLSREKLLVQLVRMAIYGLVIGMFACCSFFAFKPWVEKTFGKENQAVEIPKDEVIETPVEKEPKEPVILDGDSYRQMMDQLYLTAQEAKKSVVSIRAKSNLDWQAEVEQGEIGSSYSSGVIAVERDQEFLVIADDNVCDQGGEWEVLFSGESRGKCSLKMRDKNRGLAMFTIAKEDIPEDAKNQMQVAKFGNSNLIIQGDVVIGLGNMFGYEKGLGYGVASSVEYSEVFSDGQCGIIATDIATSQSGTGVLINQKGEVVGLIRQGIFRKNDPENPEVTANALGISDLKTVLELMLNGVEVPFAGVCGITVTTEIATEQEIPEGLYVTQVEGDSPAMAAGIQSGDILQSFGEKEVTGITTFENALLERRVGDLIKVKGQRRGSNGYVDAEFTLTVGTKK